MRGSSVIDIRTGKAHERGPAFVEAQINQAVAQYGSRVDAMAKRRVDAHKVRFDSLMREYKATARNDSSNRGDAFDPAAGLFLARQLEHRYAEVLREQFPEQNAFKLFPVDTSVPVGARTHTVSRVYQDGEAKVYRGGQGIPRVGISQQEEQFPVRHYVDAFEYDIFEAASANFANFALVSELMRVARDLIMEFANRQTWYGDEESGIKGVLNYPWLNKKVIATPFTDASSTESILAELRDLANFPVAQSKARFSPNRMVTSPRVRDYVLGRPRSTTSDKTIGAYFCETNAYITKIDAAWELQGTGPGGTDYILCYRDDRLGVSNVLVQPFTTLPVEIHDFRFTTNCYMSHGGVIMRDPLNNVLGIVEAPDIGS